MKSLQDASFISMNIGFSGHVIHDQRDEIGCGISPFLEING